MISSNGRKRIRVTLVRHGESTFNQKNMFTGWTDAELTENGISEAIRAGELLLQRGQRYTLGYTSFLKRASATYSHIVKELEKGEGFNPELLQPRLSWRLNERHYGSLQGLNKAETCEKYGKEQVQVWRRSFDVPPPLSTKPNVEVDCKIAKHNQTSPPILDSLKQDLHDGYSSSSEISSQLQYLRQVGVFNDLNEGQFAQYCSGISKLYNNVKISSEEERILDNSQEYKEVRGESLKMTQIRMKKWLRREYLRWTPGENVLIVAHGNLLRALMQTLEWNSGKEIPKLNLFTGAPILYELDGLAVLTKMYPVGEEEFEKRAKKAAEKMNKR